MYETVSTRMVRNATAVQRYDLFLKSPDIHLIDDSPYRDPALEQALELARSGKRRISVVDMVIRYMIEDVNVRSDYLLTFNPNDFRDVCLKHRVEML